MANRHRPPRSTIGLRSVPVVFTYRHALELLLKAIVLGEGGNFLATKPDRSLPSALKARYLFRDAQTGSS